MTDLMTTTPMPERGPVTEPPPPRVRARYDDGLAVYHRAATIEPATTVVYVHGAMDRAASFIRAVRRRPLLDVIRYDRRGYGRSVGIGFCATIDDQVDDLLTVLDGRLAVVVGHSLGGVIALRAAGRAPELVLSVGAFEAPLWTSDESASEAERDRADVEARADPEAAAEQFMRRMIGDDAWWALPESTRATRRAEGPALVSDLAAVRSGATPLLATAVAAPVVVGYGTRSSERHQAGARLLAQRTPGATLVAIDGAGHDAHRTHPGDFAHFVDLAVDAAVSRSTATDQVAGSTRCSD